MSAAAAPRFRPVDRLATPLAILLLLCVAISLLDMITSLLELDALERFRRGEAVPGGEVVRAIDRSSTVGWIVVATFLVTGVAWIAWQYRAQANLRASGRPRLRFSPRGAVGWWFVPLANLVRPFQAVRELWKASAGEEPWEDIPTWPVIPWWWGGWVVCSAITVLGLRARLEGSIDADSLIAGDRLAIVRDMVAVVTGVLAISLVQVVTWRQRPLAAALASGGGVLPPRPDRPDPSPFGSGQGPGP